MILPYDIQNYRDQTSLADKDYTDWHSKNTLIFGSLLDDDYDFGKDEWQCHTLSPAVLAIVRPRINKKIEDRYRYRELGVLPIRRFKDNLVRCIEDAMSAQGPVYELIAKGLDITNNGSTLVKERDIQSNFPQSQLAPTTENYATSSTEKGQETTVSGNQIKAIEAFNKAFNEPDAAVLEAVSICFSNYYSFDY